MPALGKLGVAYRYWFPVVDGNGDPAASVSPGDFTVVIRNPANDTATSATVVESGSAGLYFIDVPAAFTTTHSVGFYGLMISVDSALPTVRETIGETIYFDVDKINEVTAARMAELDPGNLPADIDSIQSDTNDIQARLPAALVGGRIDANVGTITAGAITAAAIATDAIDADALAADAVAEIADGVWDELLTGASHNIPTSAGKRLRELSAQVIHTGTVPSALVAVNQIKLAADASSVDGAFDPALVAIVDGTGVGQSRNIFQYAGATRVATVDRNWKTVPDVTSEYVIYADAGREHVNEGLAQAATANTITLNALASSADDAYLHQTIFIRSGTGDDQTGTVVAYNGTTKVATIDGTWAVNPDTTSAYAMLPSRNNVLTEQQTAYGGEITLDQTGPNGSAGVLFPVGTSSTPVDNIADMLTLLATYGFTRVRVVGTNTVGASDDVSGISFEGTQPLIDILSLTSGCVTEGTTFMSLILTGAMGGGVFCDKVGLTAVSNVGSETNPSLFNECVLLEGVFAFRASLSTPQNIQLVECVAGIASTGTGVIIDLNGTTAGIAFRKFSGALITRNHTQSETVDIAFANGSFDAESSCTGGVIRLAGLVCPIVDNSAGTDVDITAVIDPVNLDETHRVTALVAGGTEIAVRPTGDGAGNEGTVTIGGITYTLLRASGGNTITKTRTT